MRGPLGGGGGDTPAPLPLFLLPGRFHPPPLVSLVLVLLQVTHLGAKDETERQEWIEAIRGTIENVRSGLVAVLSDPGESSPALPFVGGPLMFHM